MARFSSKSAYAQMVHKVPKVKTDWDLKKVREYFDDNVKEFDTIRYMYVVDDEGRLKGVMSLKDIFRNPLDKTALEVCKKHVFTVKPDTHQEKVVYLALKNNIKAIPVVDDQEVLLGVVPSDKILSILYKESREDLLHLAGIHPSEVHIENTMDTTLLESFENRLPWLLVGMLGGIVSARIIGVFEATLESNVLLAAFIPLVVYMSNAVATQVQMLYIRDLASYHKYPLIKYFVRHLAVSFLISITAATLFLLLSIIGVAPSFLGIAVAAAIFISINLAVILALIIPYSFQKLKVDPAYGSGPLATIIQDATSVVVYFLVASSLL